MVAASIAIGCGGPGASGDDAEGGESTAGPIDLPTPDFLEPASGELTIPTTRALDIRFDINADPGVTRLVVDGDSVGTLTVPSRVGVIGDGVLQLFIRGAMVAGVHSLALRTPDSVETESSEAVTLFIESVSEPQLRWEAGTTLDHGDALVLGPGAGEAAALGLVIDDGDVAHVRVWAPLGAGWDTAHSRTVGLPGYVPGGTAAGIAIARRLDGGAQRLRVAWRVGSPGTAIDRVEVDWAGDDDGAPVRAFVPDPTWLGAREWTTIDAPLLAGELVLARITALVDAEGAHPGDHTLARLPWSAADTVLPQLVALGPVDVEGVAPVFDTLPAPMIPIGLRLEQTRPAILEIDPVSSAVNLQTSDAMTDDPRWAEVDGPLVTVLGAFRSRFVAGLRRGGTAVLVAAIDDGGGDGGWVRWIELPDDAVASGPIAAAVIDGSVALLVPRGAADTIAITISSETPTVAALGGAACDALVAGPPGVDDAADRVVVACLRERALQLGSVVVE